MVIQVAWNISLGNIFTQTSNFVLPKWQKLKSNWKFWLEQKEAYKEICHYSEQWAPDYKNKFALEVQNRFEVLNTDDGEQTVRESRERTSWMVSP
jgi:hypothetical protein